VRVFGRFWERLNGGLAAAICLGLVMAGCATPPPPGDKEAVAAFKEANDPYEPFNRAMLDFNLALDKALLRPVTSVYREAVPNPIQTGIHNFLQNLRGPVIFANDLMQGEIDRAGTTLLRLAVNSTIGILGVNDFATQAGIEKHNEDFGQTLATWDVEAGPYLVLPIFGPSNPRDGIGLLGDRLLDPLTWFAPFEFQVGRAIGSAVDKRSQTFDQFNDLERNSLDFYSAVRSLYRQKRRDEIRNGAPSANKPVPGGLTGVPSDDAGNQQGNASSVEK